MMLLLLGLALCAALGMYLFKCVELKDAHTWYEEQLAENRELSQMNDVQRRSIAGLQNELSETKRRLRDVRQSYSDAVAALDKTGSEYNWLVNELEGARIRWNRKKSETIKSLLTRMPDLSGQWAGEVQDIGPFTTHKPDSSASDWSAAPASAVRHGDTIAVCGGGGSDSSDCSGSSDSSSCGSSSSD